MAESQRAIENWLDGEFWKTGAFLTSSENDIVVLGKGGTVKEVKSFHTSAKPVFYLKNFYQDTYLAYSPATILECTREELEEALENLEFSKGTYKAQKNDDEIYQKDFNLLKESFGESLKKVVLISRENYSGFQGEETVKELFVKTFKFNAGFPMGLWNKDYGVIGSTPELLYEMDFDELKTVALAGTAPKDQEEVLLNSKKDRSEHDFVIQDIKEKLSGFSDDIEIGKTGTHPYKNLVHLKTDIKAIVDEDLDLAKLTSTLSPTAALGGYPKKASMNFLSETKYAQKYPNRYFGSCFGLISEDIKQFVVSIRNVQWKDGELFIESGGGVVQESVLEKELSEIHLKRKTIRDYYL